jgi:hypothetical protein
MLLICMYCVGNLLVFVDLHRAAMILSSKIEFYSCFYHSFFICSICKFVCGCRLCVLDESRRD